MDENGRVSALARLCSTWLNLARPAEGGAQPTWPPRPPSRLAPVLRRTGAESSSPGGKDGAREAGLHPRRAPQAPERRAAPPPGPGPHGRRGGIVPSPGPPAGAGAGRPPAPPGAPRPRPPGPPARNPPPAPGGDTLPAGIPQPRALPLPRPLTASSRKAPAPTAATVSPGARLRAGNPSPRARAGQTAPPAAPPGLRRADLLLNGLGQGRHPRPNRRPGRPP